MGVAPGRLAAAGGKRGMRGGFVSPHPSTAYVPCQLKKGTVNELLALRATGPWGVRLLRARGVPRACPRDAAYRGSVPQPEGGTSGHRHRAGLVLRGLRATRGSGGHARVDVKTVRSLLPPSQPPPRWGEEPHARPQRGKVRVGAGTVPAEPWRERPARAPGPVASGWCAMRMTVSREHKLWKRGVGKPGFPTPLPAGGPRPHAGGWGNRVSPSSTRWKGLGGRSPHTGG